MQRVRLQAPTSRAAAEMYESANGQMNVTSQQSTLTFCHGTNESPSWRFPSERDKPVRRERQLLKSYEQSGHSENGVWLSCLVPSCKQSYGGLEQQPLNHNNIYVASTSPARASDRPPLSLPHHLTAGRTRQLGGRTANHRYAVCKQLRKRHGYWVSLAMTPQQLPCPPTRHYYAPAPNRRGH